MTKNTLDYLCKASGWLVALTNIHWSAVSMSQHKLCDEIFDTLKDFRDKIAEISQGISENIKINDLKATDYNISDLEGFIKDVIRDTTEFYKNLEGDDNIGLRSVTEAFIGDFQQYIYLNRFCIKKDLQEAVQKRMSEIIKEEVHNFMQNLYND